MTWPGDGHDSAFRRSRPGPAGRGSVSGVTRTVRRRSVAYVGDGVAVGSDPCQFECIQQR